MGMATGGLVLGACVATEPATPARSVSVSGPPPAPIAEADRPVAPSAQAVWVAGYWHWTGVHYAWIPGHWEQAPPGSTWAGPQYVKREGSYFYEPGGWKNPQGQSPRANAFR